MTSVTSYYHGEVNAFMSLLFSPQTGDSRKLNKALTWRMLNTRSRSGALVGRELALYLVNLGSIPGTTHGPRSPARVIPKHSRV